MQRLLSTKASSVLYPVVIVLIVAIFSVEYVNFDTNLEAIGLQEGLLPGGGGLVELEVVLPPVSGYLSENTNKEHPIELDERPTSLTARLEWQDESPDPFLTNEPDSFRLSIASPSGESVESQAVANGVGQAGTIELAFSFDDFDAEPGSWKVIVYALDCGDQEGFLRTTPDSGNDYALQVTYKYMGVE